MRVAEYLDAAAAVVRMRGASAVLLCTEDFEVMAAVKLV